MADLQLAPARDRSVLPALLLALAVLGAIAAGLFLFNPHKVADTAVTGVQTFSPRTQLAIMDAPRSQNMRVLRPTQSAGSEEETLYLIASGRITDHLRLPLFLTGATASASFNGGPAVEAQVLGTRDVDRLRAIFPKLASMTPNLLHDGDEVTPGQTRAFDVVLLFPGQTEAAWKTRHTGSLTVQLRNQRPQTVPLP